MADNKTTITISAVDDTSASLNKIKSSIDSLLSPIGGLKTALGGLGAALSVESFVSFVHGGIKAEAALYDLALQTGITVETLSGLKGVAKLAGTDLDTVAGMVNKLQKNMLQFGTDGGGKAAQAFAQLGYTQAQVKAGLQDMDAFLPEFAKRLVQTGVGGEQAGLAMQLMAKGGAAALPFLKELAENGPLVAKVFTEQAEAAKRFEDNLIRLKAGAGALAISLANEMLPSLNSITDAMVKAKKEGGTLASIWAGLKAATVGTEKFQAEKDLFDQTSKLLSQEATLERLRREGYKDESFAVITTQKKIAGLKDEIAQSRARVELLQHEQDIREKANKFGDRTGLKDIPGAPDTSAADAAAKELARLREIDRKGYIEGLQVEIDADEQFYKDTAKLAEENNKYLEKLRAEDLKGLLAGIEAQIAEDEKMYTDLAKIHDEQAKAAKKTDSIGRELGLTFTSAFEDAVIKGKSFRDVLKGVDQDIARIIMRKAITEPLGAAVSDAVGKSSIGTSLSGLFSGLFGGKDAAMPEQLGSYASGTDYVPRTGLYQLHQGEKVTTAQENAAGGGGTTVVNINLNAIDTRTGVQFLAQNKDAIGAIVNQAFLRGGRRSGMTL